MKETLARNGSMFAASPDGSGYILLQGSTPERLVAISQNGVPQVMEIEQLRFSWQHWVLLTEGLICALLLAAAVHICKTPLPTMGGRAEHIPVALWSLAFGVVVAIKCWGRLTHNIHRVSVGRFVAFLLWVFLAVSVMLPGLPVMTWVMAPMMAAANWLLYDRRLV